MKRGWMAISVTTIEALNACISEECLAISVEQPLYHSFRTQLAALPAVQNYEITWYDTQKIAILKKTKGARRFDDQRFYIHHFFLQKP